MLRLGLSDKGEICQRVRPPFRGRLVGGARSFKWNQSLNRGSTKRNTSTCNYQHVLPNANQYLIYCSYTVIHCQTKSKTSILYFFIFTFANGLKRIGMCSSDTEQRHWRQKKEVRKLVEHIYKQPL